MFFELGRGILFLSRYLNYVKCSCKKICTILTILTLPFFTTFAIASDWYVVSKSDAVIVSVDKSSIVAKGKYVKAWILFDYSVPQKLTTTNEEYKSIKELYYYNCPEETSALIQRDFYSDTKTIEYVEAVDDPTKVLYRDYTPDTVGEFLQKFICGVLSKAKEKPESH